MYWLRMASALIARSASGPFLQSCLATCSAVVISSAAGTTLLMSP
jgi:hypothetical protein